MDIVPARRSTPYDVLLAGFKLHEADRTVALHWFALPICLGFFGLFLDVTEGGVFVNLGQFLAESDAERG
jgi:hypothetical protein